MNETRPSDLSERIDENQQSMKESPILEMSAGPSPKPRPPPNTHPDPDVDLIRTPFAPEKGGDFRSESGRKQARSGLNQVSGEALGEAWAGGVGPAEMAT